MALCKVCGWQDIGDHDCPDDRASTIWTGRWPGDAEVREYELTDLNELASMCRTDLLAWNSDLERWVKNPDARTNWGGFLKRCRDWEADRKSGRLAARFA